MTRPLASSPPPGAPATPFCWSVAQRAVNAAMCAYQIRAAGVAPDPSAPILRSVKGAGGTFFYDVMPVFQDAAGFVRSSADFAPAFMARGDDDIDAALVGLTDDGHAIVAFRGTLAPNDTRNDLAAWVVDWLNDLDSVPQPWPPGAGGDGRAPKGFADSVSDLWPWIEATLEPLLARAPNGVIFTGHSKGGAMTFLAAFLAAQKWRARGVPIQVYAFASPVAADAALAAEYAAAGLDAATHRIQVEGDMVPFLPRWDAVDIWERVRFASFLDEVGWEAATALVDALTGQGYAAVGDTVLILNASGDVETGPNAAPMALDRVATALEAGALSAIARAHGIADSYLPLVRAAVQRVAV